MSSGALRSILYYSGSPKILKNFTVSLNKFSSTKELKELRGTAKAMVQNYLDSMLPLDFKGKEPKVR